MTMADAVLERIFALLERLDALEREAQGDALEQALAAPTPEMPAEVPIEGALLAKGLEL